MLAEIFLLRLEATVRAARDAAVTSSNSRFVPITLPAAKVRAAQSSIHETAFKIGNRK